MIDLRSDTVTKPTAAMRRAIYGEDPTVSRLEQPNEVFGEFV
jgi:threonine aldolase